MLRYWINSWTGRAGQRPHPGSVQPVPAAPQDILAFATQQLNIHPDPHQAAFLLSNADQGILNCTRQWGKSTMAAIKAVHHSLTRPGSLVVIASPSERQSGLLIRKAARMLRRLGIQVRRDGSDVPSILLPNESNIVGLPGNEETIRGYSAVSLLLVDEASRLEDRIYFALRPMLAVGGTDSEAVGGSGSEAVGGSGSEAANSSCGKLWLMSTPCGRRGFFYEAWELGGDEWERIRVPATECPRISPNFLERERRNMAPMWFRQEYLAEFVDNGTTVFSRDLVEAAIDSTLKPLNLKLDLWPEHAW